MYFLAKLRIDLQIGIFGIIAQDSDFPAIQHVPVYRETALKTT
jgi:hypothetical protein